jgi:hypothetical protein
MADGVETIVLRLVEEEEMKEGGGDKGDWEQVPAEIIRGETHLVFPLAFIILLNCQTVKQPRRRPNACP